ncbi:ATP-dependent zinc metalloprotease FtsH [Aquisphaera giovannonii]|uniref:Uncharacterized AAA domain-containing protein ycf46 n=1 Tax=Aquisphaera giovannonii TaxID=406548 RepID=A0A5B9VU56_9BACT|nr:AAA family ATPase [Aquisphaera giovannonii]QEH32086.1 ATP-dependent zinc metalloprotease FtsH [Aquisphaera giovannonii]
MSLAERLSEYVRAAFAGIWIRSSEHDDALQEIAGLCRRQGWSLATWDVDRGLAVAGSAGEAHAAAGVGDPIAAIRALGSLATDDGTALLVLRNFHRLLGGPDVVQAVDSAVSAGKRARTFVVILAPVVQLPVELERQFVVIEHELPDRTQVLQIARSIAAEPGELPEPPGLVAVLEAAAGLTRAEAENAFSLSLVRHGRVVPDVLWELKARMLKEGGLMTVHRGGESFADLGGLEALKAFCRRSLARRAAGSPSRPRGILLLGVPGTGKSAFCKALGNEVGRPTLVLDIGALMGSLVGQTEERTRQALRVADAMAPCIVFVDEIEKGLAGIQPGGQSDGGVSARLFGALLSYLNDHETDVYFVCSANDVSKLPPEFTRAERFDAVYFVDLPGAAEKEQIWRLYQERYRLDASQRRPRDRDWTGAEIRACCRLASLLDVPLVEAAGNIVPVAVTAGESIERLRDWAAGRCLSADRPGIYSREAGPERPGRGVRRADPSAN